MCERLTHCAESGILRLIQLTMWRVPPTKDRSIAHDHASHQAHPSQSKSQKHHEQRQLSNIAPMRQSIDPTCCDFKGRPPINEARIAGKKILVMLITSNGIRVICPPTYLERSAGSIVPSAVSLRLATPTCFITTNVHPAYAPTTTRTAVHAEAIAIKNASRIISGFYCTIPVIDLDMSGT
jgi:hypothetical protein